VRTNLIVVLNRELHTYTEWGKLRGRIERKNRERENEEGE
jgi:hypothetical protein